jgi:hypothetical protein
VATRNTGINNPSEHSWCYEAIFSIFTNDDDDGNKSIFRFFGVLEVIYDSISQWSFLAFRMLEIKLKLSVCLIKHHAIKTMRNWGITPRILNLRTRWKWVASFMPRPLYPRGKNLWVPTDGCMDHKSGLDAVAKRKMSAPSGNRTPVVQPVV